MDGCGVAPGMEERDEGPDGKDKTWVRCGGPGSKNWGISSSHMFWDNDPVILISCVTQDKISQMRTLSLRFTPWPEYLDHVLH